MNKSKNQSDLSTSSINPTPIDLHNTITQNPQISEVNAQEEPYDFFPIENDLAEENKIQEELQKKLEEKVQALTRKRSLTNPRFTRLLNKIQGLPFWIADKTKHKQVINEVQQQSSVQAQNTSLLTCCFNHAIGLPQKNGIPLPIFDYEHELIDLIESKSRVWVKKARGLGITEVLLRYIVWLACRDNKLKNSMICIVTGPQQEIANEHIRRIEALFEPFGIYFDTKYGTTEINDVYIRSFPSKNVGAMRGYANVPLIFLDEADFFAPSQQLEARNVAEGYIPKTNPKILMVSTPDRPDGLFAKMEQEQDNGYEKVFYDYTYGVGKIYDEGLIEEERSKEYFEREYNLRYLGKLGNVFHIRDIEAAVCNEEYAKSMQESSTSAYYGRSMGLDPAWGSTGSNFGICITQYRNQRVEVIRADNIHAPYFNDVINHIMQLKQTYHITKIYVDASSPEVIKEIKNRIDETGDNYEDYTDDELWNFRNGSWQVIPINFRKYHVRMLNWTNELLQKRMIRIDPKLTELIVSLRTARAIEGKLDKTETSYSDVLDAFRLALCNYENPYTE
jgi:hypothetical protein